VEKNISATNPITCGRVNPRGGWSRAELHHGLILQNASVYTISHAVRTSGQATEDPLNLEFLSSFRCKCWTLNVILLYNSSDFLTTTWWSMKTIKREFFCDRVPEWWVHARSISPTHAGWIFPIHISCHFLTFFDTWIIVLREQCLCTLLLLVIEVKLSCNLEYFANITIEQVIRSQFRQWSINWELGPSS